MRSVLILLSLAALLLSAVGLCSGQSVSSPWTSMDFMLYNDAVCENEVLSDASNIAVDNCQLVDGATVCLTDCLDGSIVPISGSLVLSARVACAQGGVVGATQGSMQLFSDTECQAAYEYNWNLAGPPGVCNTDGSASVITYCNTASSSSTLSAGAIAGIVIGGVVLLLVIVVATVVLCRRRRSGAGITTARTPAAVPQKQVVVQMQQPYTTQDPYMQQPHMQQPHMQPGAYVQNRETTS